MGPRRSGDRLKRNLTAACVVVLAVGFQMPSMAASSQEGFAVKVKLQPTLASTSNGNGNGICTLSTQMSAFEADVRVDCASGQFVDLRLPNSPKPFLSRYFSTPAYAFIQSSNALELLPEHLSGLGLGLGTTTSLRVMHGGDTDLLEVWVSW